MSAITWTEPKQKTVEIQYLQGAEYRAFFGDGINSILLDAPTPAGRGRGPEASRLLAASIGHCVSETLVRSLANAHVQVYNLSTRVDLFMERDAFGRSRVARGRVHMVLTAHAPNKSVVTRCADEFEDQCPITATLRQAFPIEVIITDAAGIDIHRSVWGRSGSVAAGPLHDAWKLHRRARHYLLHMTLRHAVLRRHRKESVKKNWFRSLLKVKRG